MPTTFIELVNAIKEEGRVDRGNDLDNMIKRLINEVYIKHCRNKEFPDLLVAGTAINIPADGDDHFSLPANFGKLIHVRYSVNSGDSFAYLKKKNVYSLPFLTGYPQWYYRAGDQLYMYPASEVLTGGTHILQIDYYRIPEPLVDDADELEVDDLYPVIVTEVLSRIRRYHSDEQGAEGFKRESKDAMTTSQDDS